MLARRGTDIYKDLSHSNRGELASHCNLICISQISQRFAHELQVVIFSLSLCYCFSFEYLILIKMFPTFDGCLDGF